MKTFKEGFSLFVAMTLVLACFATLCIPASAATKTDIDGEIEYMLFDMEEQWSGLINQFAFQILNPAADAVVYIEEIALFTNGDDAYAYAGMDLDAEAPETEAPETEVPETEAPAPETEAPATETDAPVESGCGSVIGFGAVAILAAGSAFVALKKKD